LINCLIFFKGISLILIFCAGESLSSVILLTSVAHLWMPHVCLQHKHNFHGGRGLG